MPSAKESCSWLVAGLLLSSVGCAARKPNAALEQARTAVEQASHTPELTTNAPVPVHEADLEVGRGQKAWEGGDDDKIVEHHAYLAERYIDIARANAKEKLAANEAPEQSVSMSRNDKVTFPFDRATLEPDAKQTLAHVAMVLRQNPAEQVTIDGHTDSVGPKDYNNERLSRRRAEAVREYLVQNGAPADRITIDAHGDTKPVASNKTVAGREQNRRAEVAMKAPSGSDATAGVGRQPPSRAGTPDRATNPGEQLGAPGDVLRTEPLEDKKR